MSRIHRIALPDGALLGRYPGDGGYADCYSADVAGRVSQAQLIEAFYTTGVFKIERQLLDWFLSRPSTDADARQLARGERDNFAAWTVEARRETQLLLCDMAGRTRSWLMAMPDADGNSTRLHFGSAVVALRDARTGQRRMGFAFRALLGFHRLYSRILLRAAVAKLRRVAEIQ